MIALRKQHRRYEKHRDSGVEWLGQIPEEWKIKRLKYCCNRPAAYGLNEAAESYSGSGVRFLRTTDIDGWGNLLDISPVYLSTKTCQAYELKDDDLLLSRSGTVGRSFLYQHRKHGPCSHAGYLVRFRISEKYSPRYLFYFTKSHSFSGFITSNVIQSTIGNVNANKFASMFFSFPDPKKEQEGIADFLDEKCALIDGIIAKKQRQIELLKEKRAAIINRAVTRGLDEGVEMKKSGVEWIGKIPKSWKIRTIRNCIHGTFVNGLFKKADQFGEGTKIVNVINLYKENFVVDYEELERVNSTDAEKRTFRAQAGDIFFVRSSLKEEGIGVAAYLDKEKEQTVFECHLIKITPDPAIINSRFLAYFLNAPLTRKRVIALSQTTTMTTIAQPKLKSLEIVCPPIEIQEQIVEHLDRESDYYFSAVERIEHSISLLTEYKTSLIAHAVTGRVKVAP